VIEPSRLLHTALFEGLSETQLSGVLAASEAQSVAAGSTLLREGEYSDSLFILTSGTVEITRRMGLEMNDVQGAPRRKTLVQLTAPQFFGEMGLLEEVERSATVIARSDCQVLELRRADFERLAAADLDLAYRLVRNIAIVLASRLRSTDRDVLKLTAALSLALGNR
jgi:CRP/FNR family cyclic AMP-dependent transcriptional regulator